MICDFGQYSPLRDLENISNIALGNTIQKWLFIEPQDEVNMKKLSLILLAIFSLNSHALEYLTINVSESSGPGWGIAWHNQYTKYLSDDHRIVQLAFSPYNNKFSLYELDQGKFYDSQTKSYLLDTVAIQHIQTNVSYTGIKHHDQYLNALKTLTVKAITKYKPKHLTIKYLGHGSGWANLFGGFISGKENVQDYLQATVDALGKKIDILDWNTNCNVLSMEQLEAQADYADFFIASEFERGGFNFNSTFSNGSSVSFQDDILPLRESRYYLSLFTKEKTPREIAEEIVTKQEAYWNFDPVKADITSRKIKQTLYLIDLEKFGTFYRALDLPPSRYRGQDVLEVVQSLDPSSEENYHNMIISNTENKSFFDWNSDENGVTFDATGSRTFRSWGLGEQIVFASEIGNPSLNNSAYNLYNAQGKLIGNYRNNFDQLSIPKGSYFILNAQGKVFKKVK